MRRTRTKIVCTIGPASSSVEQLDRLARAGMDVARLNFSHGTQTEHGDVIRRLREGERRWGRPITILQDLQGPKIRLGTFGSRGGRRIDLEPGATFTLTSEPTVGTSERASIVPPECLEQVRLGDQILMDDGLIQLVVETVDGPDVRCRILVGGRISDHKGVAIPHVPMPLSCLTEKDRADLSFGIAHGIDFVAVSFVRSAADIVEVRDFLNGLGADVPIVAKLERREVMANLPDILPRVDAVMVARGDLGIEVGYAELTGLQKHILQVARKYDRVTITATQMMESMIHSPVPTRAEVSDVANAVLDGSDAVMLSGESAVGKYPVRAIEAMAEVIEGAEKYQLARNRDGERFEGKVEAFAQAIAHAVMYTANHIDVEAIVALTESGATPLWMSRIRSDIPIFAFTRNERTRRRVALYRGVYPVPFDITHTDPGELYRSISRVLLDGEFVRPGDEIILTLGELSGVSGGTNTMKLLEVEP
jgi:pyruvate kinase